jgi:hypothetical protein
VSAKADPLKSFDSPPPIAIVQKRAPLIDLVENGTIRRSRYPLAVRYVPESNSVGSSGTHSATIVATTELGRTSSFVATWSLSLPIRVSPNPLSFGLINRSTAQVDKRIIVRSLDGVPFRILAATHPIDAISVTENGQDVGTMPAVAVHVIDFKYSPKKLGRKFTAGSVTLTTDHATVNRVDVPWSAIVME